MKRLLLALALTAMASPMALATPLSPGQYSLGGIQQICLTSSLTWYGTTFPAWGGNYVKSGKTYIFGNYAGGAGNDSIVVAGSQVKADWTEWRDDLSFQTVLKGIAVSFVKSVCDPPAKPGKAKSANPAK
jgi:hypothetical protein